MRRTRYSCAVLLLVLLIVEIRAEESGISDERILFGQSAAFSGPARELGKNMRIGIEAAFQEANARGGVHGRQLILLSFDDAYEPEAAIANTQRLIEKEGVFALIGAVGTPTSRSATPIAERAGVPYIAPFTGAAFLREARWKSVINLRASYNQETEAMVARLTTDLGIKRIAVMYQDDSFGRAGYRGVRQALERRSMEPVAIGVYPRNTTAVKTGLLNLHSANPDAVILIGAYQPVATLIAWARHTGLDPVFMTISFVGSNALAKNSVALVLGSLSLRSYLFQQMRSPALVLPIAVPWRPTRPKRLLALSPTKAIWRVDWLSSLSNAVVGRLTAPGFSRVCVAQTSLISMALNFSMAKMIIRVQTLFFLP